MVSRTIVSDSRGGTNSTMGCSSPHSNLGSNVETDTEEPRREAESSKVANLGLSCEFELDANSNNFHLLSDFQKLMNPKTKLQTI